MLITKNTALENTLLTAYCVAQFMRTPFKSLLFI